MSEVNSNIPKRPPVDPVVQAILFGDVAAVEKALAEGRDVNGVDGEKNSLLHFACWAGRAPMVDMLLARGADASAVNGKGRTPLHAAVNPFAPWLPDVETVRVASLLISRWVQVDAKDGQGKTPLHVAAFNGNREVVQFLIAHGADADTRDGDHQRPLDICGNRQAIVPILHAAMRPGI